MKWLLLILIFISSCSLNTSKSKFSGDHPTETIRGMWAICAQSSVKRAPFLPPPIHWAVCDCVVDLSRGKYSVEDYEKTNDNFTEFFTKAANKCYSLSTLKLPSDPV